MEDIGRWQYRGILETLPMKLMERIKNFFLPTENNERLPGALSSAAAAFYLVLAVGLIISPAIIRVRELALLSAPASFGAGDVIALINQARTTSGLATLLENNRLDTAATEKVEDMFSGQYFAHFAPNGTSPWDFFKRAEYSYAAAGENLALDFISADEAHAAFMNSPTHRANILNKNYAEVGVAVRQGEYQGRPAIMIAQYFGKPKAVAAAPVGAAKPAAAPKPAPVVLPPAPKPVPKPVTPPSVSGATAPKPAPPLPTAFVRPTGTTTTILGTETPAPRGTSLLSRFARQIRTAASSAVATGLSKALVGQAAALLAIISLFLPLAFLLMRTGAVPHEVFLRTLFLVVVLASAAYFSADIVAAARITPDAPMTIVFSS